MSRILLLGSGHARPPLLARLSQLKRRGHDLALLSPAGMVWPEAVPAILSGRIASGAALLDAMNMARAADMFGIDDDVMGIDLQAGMVHRHEGDPLYFDILSIAPPAGTRALPGTDGHARCYATRPLSQILALRTALEARFEQHPGRVVALTIAGGGVTAITLALAIVALADRLGGHVGITILTRGRLLTGLPEQAGVRVVERLAAHGAILQEMAPVARVDGNEAVLAAGDRIAFDLFVNATGAAGPGWLQGSGLTVDAAGLLMTDNLQQVAGRPQVLAAGEAVRVQDGRHPGWASLAGNIEALALGHPLRPAPARRQPQFIDLGGGQALAWRGRHWTLGRLALWALRWAEGRWLL